MASQDTSPRTTHSGECIRQYQLQQPERSTQQPWEKYRDSGEQRASHHPKLGGGRPPNSRNGENHGESKTAKTNVTCYSCGKTGHYAKKCTQRSYGNGVEQSERLVRSGRMKLDVDTGSSSTNDLCHRWVSMRNTTRYPVAQVKIKIDGEQYT